MKETFFKLLLFYSKFAKCVYFFFKQLTYLFDIIYTPYMVATKYIHFISENCAADKFFMVQFQQERIPICVKQHKHCFRRKLFILFLQTFVLTRIFFSPPQVYNFNFQVHVFPEFFFILMYNILYKMCILKLYGCVFG